MIKKVSMKNDKERSLNNSKRCCDRGFNRTTYTYDEYVTALNMAIEALEQEPKQVEIDSYRYTFGPDEYVDYFGKCPNCGWIFEEGDDDWNGQYCCHCGQKLKWFDN